MSLKGIKHNRFYFLKNLHGRVRVESGKPLAFVHFHWWCCCLLSHDDIDFELCYTWLICDWHWKKKSYPSFGACNQVWRSWVCLNRIPLVVHSGWMWCVQLVDFCRLDDHITAVDITFLSQNFLTYHDLLWPVFTVFAQTRCVWNVMKQYALKMVCPGNPP